MANLKLNLIELGVSFVILAVFVALLVVTEDFAGDNSSLVYLVLIVAFTAASCFLGLKLAPLMYEQFS